MKDLQLVYKALSKEEAEVALDKLEEKWGAMYPSQFRKLTKTKGAFPDENSLMKLLYLGIQSASKKWTMHIWNWSLTISQLAIFFEGRLDKYLDV